MTYIKLKFDFFDDTNTKTVKLYDRCGDNGVVGLMRLWIYCKKHKQDGVLRDKSDKDIEKIICKIDKTNEGKFINALIYSEYACRWKDIKNKYRLKWLSYPGFDPPEPEELILLSWFEHNNELWPPEIERKRKIASANAKKRY